MMRELRFGFKKIIFLFLCLLTVNVFASEDTTTVEKKYSLSELLAGYLQNDLDLKKLVIDVSKADLALKDTEIDQGFNVSLSTGTMSFYKNGENMIVNLTPSISASVPKAKNLTIGISSDYEYNESQNINQFDDTKISLGIDLISSESALNKITLLESQRTLLESQRLLNETALNTEKKFYTELQAILNSLSTIYTYRQDFYTDSLDFETIKAQGYSTLSSTYRLAQMKVLDGEHKIKTEINSLKHDITLFYIDCGFKIEDFDEDDLLKYIPVDIPEVVALDFEDFPKENYQEIESASWTHKINSLKRDADRAFSLGLNGGYTFKNSSTSSDTIDAGITTSIYGIGLNTGISFPITTENWAPAVTMSATVNPNSIRKRKIKDQTYELTEQQELIDIEDANKNYETAIVDYEQSLINLNWQKNTIKESYEVYQKNEADLENYYRRGIVTQSEYFSARNNRQLYEVEGLKNKIDFILYNNEVQNNFVDLELLEEEESE